MFYRNERLRKEGEEAHLTAAICKMVLLSTLMNEHILVNIGKTRWINTVFKQNIKLFSTYLFIYYSHPGNAKNFRQGNFVVRLTLLDNEK